MSIEEMLKELRAMILLLVERQAVKSHYEIEEFARLVARAPDTCRAWARQGRIRAEKKLSGRLWVVPHAEVLRYQREGLLPVATNGGRRRA